MRLLALSLLFGCEKITVLECDGHVAGDAGSADGASADTGGKDASTGDADVDLDGGEMIDGGGMDAGMTCTPYCIASVTASLDRANVREAIMFTPVIENAGGAALMFSGSVSEISGERRAALPPIDLGDVDLTFAVDPATGVASFSVGEVPTWFSTTTFVVRIHAQANGGPDRVGEGRVTINGNVVYSGYSEVFAEASDGIPAQSQNFTEGRLLEGASFVDTPQDLLMAKDGLLLVYDHGASPPRIRRFALDAENSHVGDFQFDDAGSPIILSTHTGIGMTQLSDGRVALVEYEFTRTVESKIHVWDENGSYSHSFDGPSPSTHWSGVASDDTGKLFVLERASNGRVVEIDPATGFEQAVVTTDISNGFNLRWRPGGYFYVGLIGSMLRVTPQGGKQMINALPPSSSIYYEHIAPFGDGVIATRDTSSDYANVVVIEDLDFARYLRRENVGNPITIPEGLEWLD
jgi:hypothetical protein